MKFNYKSLLKIAVLSLISTSICVHFSLSLCQAQVREPSRQERFDDLNKYKRDLGVALNRLPRVTNKSKERRNNESMDIDRAAFRAYKLEHLEEAEEKLATSLSLAETQESRQFYAFVLIEEKKYLEALPSCVDIALEEHEDDHRFVHQNTVEYDTLSHLMLAHVLAQIGDLRTAAIAYNFTRAKVEWYRKWELELMPLDQRQKFIDTDLSYRLPLPPLQIDPDKADRKSLIEATRILFLREKSGHFIADPRRFDHKMIDDAYADNTGSAELTYLKGWVTGETLDNGLKSQLAAAKASQPFFAKAAEMAGPKTSLGKMALQCLKVAQEDEIDTQRRVDHDL